MEMLVIALVAIVAFAAVLVPLFRRPAGGDAREFDGGDPVTASTPMSGDVPAVTATDDELEREILRYRVAVRAGTVCRTCGQANPAESLFCFECGAKLAPADAQEYG